MRVPPVRSATPADEGPAIDAIVLAFAADPVARWCWPDAHQYLASMPGFTRAFGGGAFVHNGAHCTDDYAGAALWLPPNVHSDEEALGEILERTVSASIRGTRSASAIANIHWRTWNQPIQKMSLCTSATASKFSGQSR